MRGGVAKKWTTEQRGDVCGRSSGPVTILETNDFGGKSCAASTADLWGHFFGRGRSGRRLGQGPPTPVVP